MGTNINAQKRAWWVKAWFNNDCEVLVVMVETHYWKTVDCDSQERCRDLSLWWLQRLQRELSPRMGENLS